MKDYYKILGVNRNASDDEIKKAYRKLAKQYHPDANPNDKSAEVKFKEIGEAFEAIKNGEAAQQNSFNQGGFYQQSRSRGGRFHDVFEDMFMNDFDNFFGSRARRHFNENYSVVLTLTLEEVFTGVEKDLNLRLPDGQTKKVKINIPRSINDGHKILVKGQGASSNTQIPPGDIVITCKVTNHAYFKRHVNNLLAEIEISVFDMILGAEKTISTIDGSKINLKIPAGSSDGSMLRVAGKGMHAHHGAKRGDLIVTVKSIIPKITSAEDINLVRQLHQKYS